MMSWDKALDSLLNVLADLFGTEEDARRIAKGAELDEKDIDFSGKAVNVWTSLLTRAYNNSQVDDVIRKVQAEYPESTELKMAVEHWSTNKGQSSEESNGSHKPKRNPAVTVAIVTGIFSVVVMIGTIIGPPLVKIFLSTPTPTITPTATITATPTPTINPTATFTPTPIPVQEIYDIHFCDKPCGDVGSSRISSALERAERFYVGWSYRGMTQGLRYSRIWSMNGNEWIRYDCVWKGQEQGAFTVILREPKGLRSGSWTVTFLVEGQQVAQASIYVEGNYDYWDPAGLQPCPDF